jgi:hypothetical protein
MKLLEKLLKLSIIRKQIGVEKEEVFRMFYFPYNSKCLPRFMGMLGEKYPKAQFVITGVLGPGSNAHGNLEH